MLKSGYFRKFLLSLGSAIVAVSLLEVPVLFQVLDYRTLIGPSHIWFGNNITDPGLLIIHRPHARQKGSSRGGDAAAFYQIPPSDLTLYRWDLRYDQHGFRNQTDLRSADIAVIGDSFVEGWTVLDTQLTTSLLAQLQGKVVANLGQSTYGPLQELIVLKRYGLPLRPRLVLWMFFEGNDLGDVISYRREVRNQENFWRAFVRRSFTRSAAYEVKRILSRRVKPPGVQRSGLLPMLNGQTRTVYFIYRSGPYTKDDLSALDETALTLTTAHQLCAAQGAHLLFVFIPEKFRVFQSFCQFSQESECRNWVLNDMPERLRSALGSVSSEIGYLDLTPSLVDSVKKGALPYYPDDEHWSPEGHQIAAEAINNYLSSTAGPAGTPK